MTRIAVAGLGLIGARHARAVLAHAGCTLAAVIDPVADVRAAFDVPGFDRIEDVNLPVDGVILATPTPLHTEHAGAAAQKSWPMLIEKPIAATLDQADALVKATEGLPVLIGHHRRYHASLAALKAGLEAGRIGTPVTASLIWAVRKPDAYFQGNWRSTDGSPVIINLVHDLDVLRGLFGDITAITALPGARTRGADRVESGAIALRFASGTVASVAFADTAPSPWGFEAGTGENPNIGTTGQDMLWVTGTSGGVSFPSLTWWHGTDWSEAAKPVAEPAAVTIPLDAQLDHFLEVIAGTAKPLVSAEDGRAALAAALEIEAQLQEVQA